MRTARLLTISQHALHWRVGVYPSMHWAGGCLPKGVSAQGVCPPWGVCLGVSAQELSAQWAVVPLSRGVSASGPRECIPACNGADTPLWTDRHL